MEDDVKEEGFDPSCLGTSEHWESIYENELSLFESIGDEGENWFGEDVMESVIEFIVERLNLSPHAPIVDIGCGNGVMMCEIATEGFLSVYGLDYSPNSIMLAERVCEKRGFLNRRCFPFLSDFLAHDGVIGTGSIPSHFMLVHDKATYDAISLAENSAEVRKKYRSRVLDIVDDDGFFLITSCNWTEEELIRFFMQALDHPSESIFELFRLIDHPRIMYGGREGSTVSSVCFRKKKMERH
eukprot:TRINITY_DN101_c0_g1_i1.p2 TRINITY_DN101_c0_g1~~TRINITY_DN101_c0_g1_i1.p2  ORF type:complete len:241 (+),score=66.80 TRINITY_DN101_c0_g1_i1:501-1223(+)